jgi:hypothetical protein
MTISANYTFDLDLAGLARVILRAAGVLGPYDDPSPEEISEVSDLINIELKEWQAGARLLRQVERVTKTLTAGTATVTVDADTIDIEFPAYITLTTGNGNYLVRRMTLDEYMRVSDKTVQGVPSRALIERKDTVVMTLDPIPDSTVASITYARVKLIRDIANGATADLQQRHLKALIATIAAQVAESRGKSADKIARLEARAANAKAVLAADSSEKGSFKFVLR